MEISFSSCRIIALKDGSFAQLIWHPTMIFCKTKKLQFKNHKYLQKKDEKVECWLFLSTFFSSQFGSPWNSQHCFKCQARLEEGGDPTVNTWARKPIQTSPLDFLLVLEHYSYFKDRFVYFFFNHMKESLPQHMMIQFLAFSLCHSGLNMGFFKFNQKKICLFMPFRT